MSNAAKRFTGEIGIHYPLHVLNRYSLPELIGLAERAWQILRNFGFSQVWTNDNLEYRSVLASSAAIVARLPVKLGTAVTVPYFRNPVDLAIFKTANQVVVEPGEDLFYTLTVSNRGPDNATDVVVTDTLPDRVTFVVATDACVEGPSGMLTCRLGDLAAGKTVTFIIKVVVDDHIRDSITITNRATVTSAQLDPDNTNNTAKVTTIVEKEKRHR